ncbi:hypothetical protein Tco_0150398 [Tanacetum coccineum]
MKAQQSTNTFVKETFMELKTQIEGVTKNHQALIQNLEAKFDRLADKQSGRPSRSLPSNPQPNPRKSEAFHDILNGIGNDIYSTMDACVNGKEMWLAIELEAYYNYKAKIQEVLPTTKEENGPFYDTEKLEKACILSKLNVKMLSAGRGDQQMATKVKMDDPNITMKEYIRLEEEKALSHGETFNWQTATYGKMEYFEDEDDCFTNFESEFPAIILDDTLTSREALSWEPTVSPLNDNEIDIRISFDESDNEYYMVIYDKNSFSYKIIFVDNLKMDSKNDNDKVNMPLFLSPKHEVSYSNDLDFFKDFDHEFLAIVYNDALTSKLDFLTEHTISFQHINEFDLKDETSLSECDEEEQNVIHFNDLFPFNMIYLDDLKLDTDNDNDKINIEQPPGDMSIIPLPNEPYGDLDETMIWYILKKTCVELI